MDIGQWSNLALLGYSQEKENLLLFCINLVKTNIIFIK